MAVFAANKTEILFDGEKIHGLEGFTYEVDSERRDVPGIGTTERSGVVYGRLRVKGKILVHSNSELLNGHMENNTHFQIIMSIMQDSYPEGLGVKKFTFDGCHVDRREFQLGSHGYALTTYSFSADRIREE
jgi:hypothetical protein